MMGRLAGMGVVKEDAMNSLKTAVVVTVLLGVMYGVYTTLTTHPGGPSSEDSNSPWPAVNLSLPGKANGGAERANPSLKESQVASWPPTGRSDVATSPASPENPGRLGGSPSDKGNWPNLSNPFAKPSQAGDKPSVPNSVAALDPRVTPASAGQAQFGAAVPATGVEFASSAGIRAEFRAMMDSVQRRLDQGQLAEVLLELSPLYGSADLTPDESRQLTELLDQLAGTVIYSRQHLLEPPYVVKRGDTLEQIAAAYEVPWQLLAKINGIRPSSSLVPGRELKVVRGPFEAVVRLDHFELVLYVGGRYAGRFPIGIGRDQPRLEGTYTVREKLPGKAYRGPEGEFLPGDPRNPLGRLWIGLDGPVGIHGTNDPQNLRRVVPVGNICLGERDIEDLYDILSCGSRVTIRR